MRSGDAARDQDADAALTPRQRQLVRPASGRRRPHPSAHQGGTPSPRSQSRTSQAFLSALRREGTENAASRAARTVHVRGIPPKHGSRAALRAIVEKVGAVVSVEVMGQSFLPDQDGAPLAGGIEEIMDGASSYCALVTWTRRADALAFCCYDTRVQRGCYTARKTWECKMVAPEQMRSLAAQFAKARRDAEAAADSRLRSLGQTAAASIEVTLDAIGDGSSAVNQGNVAVTTGPGSPPAATPAIIGAATDRTPTVWSPQEPTMKIAGKHAGMTVKGRRFFTVFPAPSSSSPRTEEGEPRSLPRLPATDSGGTADRLQEKLGQMREGSRAREVAAPEIRSPATPVRTGRERRLSSAKRTASWDGVLGSERAAPGLDTPQTADASNDLSSEAISACLKTLQAGDYYRQGMLISGRQRRKAGAEMLAAAKAEERQGRARPWTAQR